jgi:hypothetical protein
MVSHPGLDHRNTEGLDDVVHGAEFQAEGFVGVLAPGRHENHRYVLRAGVGLQAANDFKTIHAGHHDVEQDQVGLRIAARDAQGQRSVGGNPYCVVGLQAALQDVEVFRCVIDEQDGWPWARVKTGTCRGDGVQLHGLPCHSCD